MTLPVSALEAGKCYLVSTERGHQVRRVVRIMPDGRVQFERRAGTKGSTAWVLSMADTRAFAAQAEREVLCDWTPEGDG